MAGITFAGKAGMSKEKEMTVEQKTAVIGEFNLKKGVIVATFSGVMSACFSFGLDAGAPIKALALQHGTSTLWQGLPVLVVLLAGGFTTNFIWCLILNIKNHTGYQYFSATIRTHHPARGEERILENAIDAPSEEMVEAMPARGAAPERAPMLNNYFFAALAGTVWYFQFFFYTMGETQMGKYKFSSWTLHMASIIIFSSLWGIALHEWRGASRRTKTWLAVSLLTLVGSTIVVGYGNYLGTLPVR
jgi:L-rhamnose-H+ transport protein